ncbi:MAG TPA: hypothetical protein V6D29_18390 [Leptolyngbyaceae cyanobacterium]
MMYVNAYTQAMADIKDREAFEDSSVQESKTTDRTDIEALLSSGRRANRMILIGAPDWVRKIIHLLHAAHITEVKDWSRLMQTRNPNEVISLMQRPRLEKQSEKL